MVDLQEERAGVSDSRVFSGILSKLSSRLFRLLKFVFHFFVFAVLLLEEWLWEPLEKQAARLGRIAFIQRVEKRLAQLSPFSALLAFGLPTVFFFPLKILAVALVARGQFRLALLIVFTAKILGTALVARIFTLTKPQLLRVDWFRKSYDWIQNWKQTTLKPILFWWKLRTRILKKWIASLRGDPKND